MKQEKTTAQKRNAYEIRMRISQAIFKEFIDKQGGEVLRGTVFTCFNRPLLSSIANLATGAIMKEPSLDVILKKDP